MSVKKNQNIRLTSLAATDIGKVRHTNQDSYGSNRGVYVLADGMGGHQGGEVASREAVSTILENDQIKSLNELIRVLSKANQLILKRSKKEPALTGMGTTICVLAEICDDDGNTVLAVANVGDSRVYRFGNGVLTQVSQDHSLVADLVRAGELTPEEAARHPQRNILTRALGIEEQLVIDTWKLLPVVGDRYLLCSDGLFNELEVDQIIEILLSEDLNVDVAQILVRKALEAGGNDNVTVLVVDVEEADHDDPNEWVLPEMFSETSSQPLLSATIHVNIKNFEWKPIAIGFAILLLIVSVFGGIGAYARSGWFIGEQNGNVAIYKGRSSGVLWFDPSLEETTNISLLELSEEARILVVDSIPMGSLSEAKSFIKKINNKN